MELVAFENVFLIFHNDLIIVVKVKVIKAASMNSLMV